MSSKVLDFKTTPELQPITELRAFTAAERPAYRFTANTPAEAVAERSRIRPVLARTVGWLDSPTVDPEAEVIERTDMGDHVREKVVIRTAANCRMPAYLLTPKLPGPRPTVLALHGHGYGVKDIVGLKVDGSERGDDDPGYHKDFGVALCRRGFAVAAPEISCFGERQADLAAGLKPGSPPPPSTCTQTAYHAMHHGKSVIGLRVRDAMRLIDYIAGRDEFDTGRLGAMGISGGGFHSFFSTCLDPRIKACVVSGYFCYLHESILAVHHCVCNLVPGLAAFGELPDLAGLIAPRPMLVESGTEDGIFPVDAVRAAVDEARRQWALHGCPENLETDIFTGGHQISGVRAYDFLAEHLGLE